MTTILTRFTFLALVFNTALIAKDINVTFEVMQAENNYLDVAREKALELNQEGLDCYILKGATELSLRCNDATSIQEMQASMKILKEKNVDFSMINKSTTEDKEKYKSLNEFYLGYSAFDRKDYERARDVFKYNYTKENNYEHAYAYALVLMKLKKYEEAMGILEEYREVPKANKLYSDIGSIYMYQELNKKNYRKARSIVNKYKNKSKKLHNIINKQEVNDSIQSKNYTKASTLAKSYKFENKTFEIDYMKALSLVTAKKYEEANKILSRYKSSEAKAKSMYIDNIMALASIPYAKKNYKAALDKLEPYKSKSYKVKRMYSEIMYNRLLDNGWKALDKEPALALKSFKASCEIKKEYSCYSGMMYSYYNLKKYKEALYLADKLYKSKPNEDLATIGLNSSLEMKNYQEAKKWFKRTKNKESFTSPYLLESFITIDNYTKAGKYNAALKVINRFKKQYPENMNILTREMQVYGQLKEYDKAQNVAQDILNIDPESLPAKYTLALYEFEHGDYLGCTQRLDTLELQETYQEDLYYRCSAYTYVSQKDMKHAELEIEKVHDLSIQEAYYYDVGDMYRSIGDERAISAYEKARTYNKSDIETEFLYLYTLQEFKKYKALDDEIARAYEEYPQNINKINKFRIAYEKDRLFKYYSNEEYEHCYEYSQNIELSQNRRDLYQMRGWCAFNMEDYSAAKDSFAIANLRFGETNDDIYAYALAAYNNNENDRATEALSKIRTIENDEEAYLIAELYMNLREQTRAEEIVLQLEETNKQKMMLSKIKRSERERVYESSASAGMYLQSQTGSAGKSHFEKFTIPIDYNYYDKTENLHLYAHTDMMYLYNGNVSGQGNSLSEFGLGTTTQSQVVGSEITFMPTFGIDYGMLHATLGLTPIGAEINPTLTWSLAGYMPLNDTWNVGLRVEQLPIDETMLSFVGEKAVEGGKSVTWGRVLKRGIIGSLNYNGGVDFSLALAYYPSIYGVNVQDNSEKKVSADVVYHIDTEKLDFMDIGAGLTYDSYDKNLNLFTYGNGGYFSPQQYFLGAVHTKLGDVINKNWYYQTKLELGFEGSTSNSSKEFPLNDGVVNSTRVKEGIRSGSLVYKGAIQLGYKMNEHIDFISGLSIDQIKNYEMKQMNFSFVYRFNAMRNPSLNTFTLNHRTDQIIK